MEIQFVQSYFEDFSHKLEKIIYSIENQCNCILDYHSVMMLISKLNFYAENFFIDNELAKKDNSVELKILKKQSQLFFSVLKDLQKRYESGEKKVIYEIKDFLKNWLKKPILS